MNAYNPLAAAHRLESTGLSRKQAEAIATEITVGTDSLVTQEQLEAALDKQTIRLSIILGGIITLTCTVLGVILSH